MTIQEFLKEKDFSARVSVGRTWLVWDEIYKEWVVYTHPYCAKKVKVLYRGGSEEDAVKVLQMELEF
jgi:hypothetical protein